MKCHVNTVPTTPVSTKPVLCTNRPNFTMLFYFVKVSPHSCLPVSILALTRALKSGTVWTSISTGTGIVKGQTLSNQIYLIKNAGSLWPFTIPVPVEVEVHKVPHFKAPVNAKVEPGELDCSSIFT